MQNPTQLEISRRNLLITSAAAAAATGAAPFAAAAQTSQTATGLTGKVAFAVNGTRHELIRERMSGNICRCGAYSNIVDAITDVAGTRA